MHNLDGLTLLIFFIVVLLAFGGNLWFLAEAFRKSIGWGLAVIFIPFASLAFLATNLERAGKPFVMSVSAVAIFFSLFYCNQNFREALTGDGQPKAIAQVVKTAPAPVARTVASAKVAAAVTKHVHQSAVSRHHHGH